MGIRSKVLYNFKSIIMNDTHVKILHNNHLKHNNEESFVKKIIIKQLSYFI